MKNLNQSFNQRKTRLAYTKNSFIKKTEAQDDPILDEFLKSTNISKEESAIIKNGLADAIGYTQSIAVPGQQGEGVQLSQKETLFKNLSWSLVSNYRQLLSQAYVEFGLIKTIVDMPVDDSLRGGIDISTKQLDEDQIKELNNSLIENNDINCTAQAHKWNRLYGGAGILIITGQDSSTPLDLKEIANGEHVEFKAVDMWELFFDKINVEDDNFQDNGFEMSVNNIERFNYYNKLIHKSRVIIMKGLEAPSFIRPKLRGWGMSVVEDLIRSLNQYLKANNLTFELMDELKIDVYKFDKFNEQRAMPGGDEAIRKRAFLTNWMKNYLNGIVMDKNDDFAQKELSLGFLPETMNQSRIQLASDLRMPMTKLFGISSAGFNSGEDEIENYNGMVDSQVRQKMHHHLIKVTKIRCLNKFGFIPADLQVSFKPLRVMSSEQEENIKNQKFTRLFQAFQAGLIDAFEFKEACNRDKLLSIQLDTSKNQLNLDGSSEKNKDGNMGDDSAIKDQSNEKKYNVASQIAVEKPNQRTLNSQINFLNIL